MCQRIVPFATSVGRAREAAPCKGCAFRLRDSSSIWRGGGNNLSFFGYYFLELIFD